MHNVAIKGIPGVSNVEIRSQQTVVFGSDGAPMNVTHYYLDTDGTNLTQILSCYSIGVSKGNWKDYSINFKRNEAIFFIYKHSWATPYCVLIKSKEVKKKKITYGLSLCDKKKSNFSDIDKLIKYLRRKQLKII